MVSLGKGDDKFYPSVGYATPVGRFEAGTHGDFNGDAAVDLAYPTIYGVTVVTNDRADFQNLAGAVAFQVSAPATTSSGSVLPMTNGPRRRSAGERAAPNLPLPAQTRTQSVAGGSFLIPACMRPSFVASCGCRLKPGPTHALGSCSCHVPRSPA